jgi:hypothetical protein
MRSMRFFNIRNPYILQVLGASYPWGKLRLRNSLYIKDFAIFSEEPLETQPGFSEVPYIFIIILFIQVSSYFVPSYTDTI